MHQVDWLRDHKIKLYQSENWRQFVELYWAIGKRKPVKINYAELSRKANYSSRAFLFEILTGKKKISPSVTTRLAVTLKLKGTEKKLFYLLTKKEINSPSTNLELVESIKGLQNKLILQNKINDSSQSISDIFSGYHVYSVYAALGRPDQGATLVEILGKTKIPEAIVKQVLKRFIVVNCIEIKEDRYHLTNVSLDLKNLGSNINFKETFLKALDEIKKRSRQMELYQSDFYFHTAIPIRKGTQLALKEKLRECILDFVDNNDEGSGDEIVHINLSAYRD